MAKNLDAGTSIELLRKTGAKPVIIVRVDWGGGVGTRFYADRELQFVDPTGSPETATLWGVPYPTVWGGSPAVPGDVGNLFIRGFLIGLSPIKTQWSDGNMGTTGSATVTLQDDVTQGLRINLNTGVLESSVVTIYQWFQDASTPAELTIILKGVAASPVSWNEATHQLTFDVTPQLKSGTVGILVTSDLLADVNDVVSEDAIGSTIPLCFGQPNDVPALLIQTANKGELRTDVAEDDLTFRVKGGKDFEQGTVLTLQVGEERITGQFNGTDSSPSETFEVQSNAFTYEESELFVKDPETITHNGRNVDAFSDVTVLVRSGDNKVVFEINHFDDPSVFYVDNPNDVSFVGLVAYVKQNNQVTHFAPVIKQERLDPNIGGGPKVDMLFCARSLGLLLGGELDDENAVSFTAIKRRGWDKKEDIPRVWPAGTDVIVAESRNGTYVVNSVATTRIVRVAAKRKIKTSSSDGEKEVLTTIPDDWYTATLADQTYITGEAVTKIEFDILPEFRGLGFTNELFVTLVSSLSNIPSEGMKFILQTFGDIDVDSSSFNALNQRTGDTPMDWALQETKDALTLANEMAFQARCTIININGILRLRFVAAQTLGSLAPVVLTDDTNIEENSIILEHTPTEDIVTQLTGIYKASYFEENDRKLIAQNNIDRHGNINEDIDYFIFQKKEAVRVSISFWSGFKSTIWRMLRVSSFLDPLALEALDSILVVSDLLIIPTGVYLRAHEVDLDPLNDRMTMLLWTPFSVGSSSSSPDAFIDVSPDDDLLVDDPDEMLEEQPPLANSLHIDKSREGTQNADGAITSMLVTRVTKGAFDAAGTEEEDEEGDQVDDQGKYEGIIQADGQNLDPEEDDADLGTKGEEKIPVTTIGPMKPTTDEITMIFQSDQGYIYFSPIAKWL